MYMEEIGISTLADHLVPCLKSVPGVQLSSVLIRELIIQDSTRPSIQSILQTIILRRRGVMMRHARIAFEKHVDSLMPEDPCEAHSTYYLEFIYMSQQ